MILSRFSSCKRLRHRAVPSPASKAEFKLGCVLRSDVETYQMQMPGILALFEDAVLNDTAPIIGDKNDERIADGAICQLDGSSRFWDTILPLAHHDGIDRLTHILPPMGQLRLRLLSIAVITGQGL